MPPFSMSKMMIPDSLKNEYPFNTSKLILSSEIKLSYVDEGKGDSIVMVHGNPTWSFYYRNLIKEFSKDYRVIAPDHIGCGLSDKPQDYSYTLKNHINNLEKLINHLNLKNIHLVVHDWGGAIGFGYATKYPKNIKSITILNTAAFRSTEIPFRISLCKLPIVGEPMVRAFNAFAWPATFMTTKKSLSKIVKKGYLFPYNNYRNRIATARFVKDIPLSESHESYRTLYDVEQKLQTVSCPKLILWGGKDFCFTKNYFKRWLDFFPSAKAKMFENAGHYVIEDKLSECILEMKEFLNEHST
jgi:haloalkane dehalogenase